MTWMRAASAWLAAPLAGRWRILFVIGVGQILLMLVQVLCCGWPLAGAEGLDRCIGLVALLAGGLMWTGLIVGVIALSTIRPAGRWWFLLVAVTVFGLGQAALYGDLAIQSIYGYHINGFVLDMITSPAAADSVDMGAGTRWHAIRDLSLLLAVSTGLVIWALIGIRRAFPSWLAWTTTGLAILVLLMDLTMVAIGSWWNVPGLLAIDRRLGPLHPLPMETALEPHPCPELHLLPTVRPSAVGPFACAAEASRPDLLILVVEGGRADALNPAVMPHLAEFASSALVAETHVSGGNTTQYALFSLFTGRWATAWPRSPAPTSALFALLGQRGYHTEILSCTDLYWPDLRSACLSGVETVSDRWPDGPTAERWRRDQVATDRVVAGMRTPPVAGEATCRILIFDASHFPYVYPPETARCAPATGLADIDVLDLVRHPDPEALERLRNRHRNALHFIDGQIGRILDALREGGRMDRTAIFVVGDHGEEFGGHPGPGHLIHHGAFCDEQIRTLCVARWPGGPVMRQKRLTSHCDLLPTVARILGVQDPPSRYCQGVPLDEAQGPGFTVVADCGEAAVVDADVVLRFGLGACWREAYDRDPWRRHDDPSAAFQARAGILAQVVEGLRSAVRR